jgi:hypothetical protein
MAAVRTYVGKRPGAGLPDFAWSKRTKMVKNIPKGHKLYQTAINLQNGHTIFQM